MHAWQLDSDGDLDLVVAAQATSPSSNFRVFENTGSAATPDFREVNTAHPLYLNQSFGSSTSVKPMFADVDGALSCIVVA